MQDSSDIYGSPGGHENEYLFGELWASSRPSHDLVTPQGCAHVLMLHPGSTHTADAPAHLPAGKALKGDASAYQMATKFGIVYTPTEFGVNGKKEYVRSCVEGSLKRLGVECIDLYYQVGSLHPTCRELPDVKASFAAISGSPLEEHLLY